MAHTKTKPITIEQTAFRTLEETICRKVTVEIAVKTDPKSLTEEQLQELVEGVDDSQNLWNAARSKEVIDSIESAVVD